MLSANHGRYLAGRLNSLDESLTEALQSLEPREDGRLHRRLIPDATPAQRQVLKDCLAQLRFVVRRFIDGHQLPDPAPPVSGLKSFQVALTFARIAVEELRPGTLRGYGALDEGDAQAVEQLAAQLHTLLQRMSAYLVHGEGEGLSGRLKRLQSTSREGALLRELSRIITEYGLVELRAPLERLADRLASPRLEIAVFGRVNAGKSSLLNAYLEHVVLPTGVTPVTAVPTRIVGGEPAGAWLTTATARAQPVPIAQLSRFLIEECNPGNREGVVELLIQVPAPRLASGVILVDTPGLGSLVRGGAQQTLEYLPRCDLGIVMIEAGGTLTREDLDVARALMDGGSELVVVLSKADRLSAAQLTEARGYAEAQFRSALGMSLRIGTVSTVTGHAASAASWFDEVLEPFIAHGRERAAVALKRKTGALREIVVAELSAWSDTVIAGQESAQRIVADDTHHRPSPERVAADLVRLRDWP